MAGRLASESTRPDGGKGHGGWSVGAWGAAGVLLVCSGLSLCSHSGLWLMLLRKLASCLSACQIEVQGPLTQRSSEWGRESDEIMAAK